MCTTAATLTHILHLCFICCQIPGRHSVSLPLAIHFMLTQYQSAEVPSPSAHPSLHRFISVTFRGKQMMFISTRPRHTKANSLLLHVQYIELFVWPFQHFRHLDIFAAISVVFYYTYKHILYVRNVNKGRGQRGVTRVIFSTCSCLFFWFFSHLIGTRVNHTLHQYQSRY